MDYDISRWLKDDLGLVHSSEHDLNSLMFHPRHGTLCRSLVKFLAQSTLCSRRYPNVYARDDYEEATRELESKKAELAESMRLVEQYSKRNENEQRELTFLKSKLDCLRNIRDQLEGSIKDFEEIASRPSFGMEQVARNLGNTNYLSDSSLLNENSLAKLNKLADSCGPVSAREISMIDREFNDLIHQINLIHKAVAKTLYSINREIDPQERDMRLKKPEVHELVALQLPQFEEITVDPNPEERELKESIEESTIRVKELNQQVIDISALYVTCRAETVMSTKVQLKECLKALESLEEIERIVPETK